VCWQVVGSEGMIVHKGASRTGKQGGLVCEFGCKKMVWKTAARDWGKGEEGGGNENAMGIALGRKSRRGGDQSKRANGD